MEILKKTIRQNDIFRALKIRPLLFLMLSEFFSQIAFNMQHFVIIFIIYEITKSNTAVSGVILAFIIPAIIFSFIAGVYVDRWNKKKVLLITNIIRGVISLLFLLSGNNIAIMYSLTFFIAVSTQFFLPAEAPMIPLLVNKNLLVPANALFAMGIFTTVFIGYILSGPTLIFFGKNSTFLLLALFFFVSAILIQFVKLSKKKEQIDTASIIGISNVSFVGEIKEVLSFIKKAKDVTNALIIIAFSQAIIFTLGTLGPGYVATILGTQVENLSWIFLAPAAFGMVLGALVVGSFSKKFKNHNIITMGFLISGIVLMLLPFGSRVASREIVQTINSHLPSLLVISILHIIIVMAFLLGFANALIYIPANATLQKDTNDELRGRIYGFLNAFVAAVSFLPVVVAGSLADILGVGRVLSGVGIAILITGILRFYPYYRKRRKKR